MKKPVKKKAKKFKRPNVHPVYFECPVKLYGLLKKYLEESDVSQTRVLCLALNEFLSRSEDR